MTQPNSVFPQLRWATTEEFDPDHLATIVQRGDGQLEVWAAVVVDRPPALIALGGTRNATEGNGIPMSGTAPDLASTPWSWRRENNYIVLMMHDREWARIKEIATQ